ncbi:hypothetical protein ES708_32443 [subsurface metagenome]
MSTRGDSGQGAVPSLQGLLNFGTYQNACIDVKLRRLEGRLGRSEQPSVQLYRVGGYQVQQALLRWNDVFSVRFSRRDLVPAGSQAAGIGKQPAFRIDDAQPGLVALFQLLQDSPGTVRLQRVLPGKSRGQNTALLNQCVFEGAQQLLFVCIEV